MHQNLSIQNSRHSKYCESLKYSLHRTLCNLENSQPCFHIQSLAYWNTQNPVKHLWWAVFYRTPCKSGMFRIKGTFRTLSNIYDKECYSESSQPAWDVSERSQSDPHWERQLRDLLETSQKRCLFCDVFKTSRAYLKKDVFSVTSLRRLRNISRKCLWFFKNTPQKWFRVIFIGLLQYLIK